MVPDLKVNNLIQEVYLKITITKYATHTKMKGEIKCSRKAEKGTLSSNWGPGKGRESGASQGRTAWRWKADSGIDSSAYKLCDFR